MKTNILIIAFSFLGMMLVAQENNPSKKIEMRTGIIVHDNSFNVDTGFYKINLDVNTLLGFKNEVLLPTKKEHVKILIGFFLQTGKSSKSSEFSQRYDGTILSKRQINNGGIYVGACFTKGKTFGFSSSFSLGMNYYENSIILKDEDGLGLYEDKYSETKALSMGAHMSVGPYIQLKNTKINLLLDGLCTGNNKFMHYTYGGSLLISYLL